MLKSYIAFDLETTGLSPQEHEIIEIGALKVREGKVVDRFMEFVHPDKPITPMITNITHITNDMVAGARSCPEVIHDFLSFCEDDVLIGHNVMFDYSFVKCSAVREGLTFEKMGIDSMIYPEMLAAKSLGALCDYYHIENPAAHRAYYDALATAKLYQTLAHYFEPQDPKVFQPLQLQYKIKKVQPATPKQIALLERLTEQKELIPDWDAATLTRSEASRIIDRLLKS